MNVAVVKYNAGNVESVVHALGRLGVIATLTDDAEVLSKADKVIFPGVGEASSAMKYLNERGLSEVIITLKQPVLGICLGLQLLCSFSEENQTNCLNVVDSKVQKFTGLEVKVPHMGWNQITNLNGPLFRNIENGSFVYFVHSYYTHAADYTIASASHGEHFSAAIKKDNFYGVQFHPEKSANIGEQILTNFLSL